jgi:hypothetical protein
MKTARAVSALVLPLVLLVAAIATGCGGQVSVSIIPALATVTPGGSVTFQAVVSGASDRSVTWSVPAGPNAGSITSTGIYTAPPTPGTYQVKATSVADPSQSATAEVTVQADIAISITPTPITVSTQARQTFTATVTGTSDRGVTWSIEEGPVGGTLDAEGTYTAPASPGTFHVVATSRANPTRSARATVTVTRSYVASVAISPALPTVVTGQFLPFAAQVSGVFYSADIDWSVLEAGGGAITRDGLYIAPSAEGVYHVIAASQEDATRRALATVDVKAPQGVSVWLTPRVVTVTTQGKQTFSASVSGATNKQVTWSVLESAGGTISPDGLYTAPSTPGTYTVVVTSQADPSKSSQALVNVTSSKVLSLAINPSAIRLSPGAVTTFTSIVSGVGVSYGPSIPGGGVSYAPSIQWRVLEGSAGGSVTEQGAYVAPNTPGVYHVAAEASSGPDVFSTVTVE